MAATLTDAMKADLATGNATILLAPYATGGLKDTTFTDADKLFTTKDSFKITEGDPDMTILELDQNGGEKYDQIVASGESTVEGVIPFASAALLDYFYNKGTTATTTLTTGIVSGSTTYKEAHNYSFNKKIVKVKMFVESNSKNNAIVLHNVGLMVTLIQDTVNTTPLGFKLSGKIYEDGAFGAFANMKPSV